MNNGFDKLTTRKPKILYLITQAEWGGAQRYVFDLATSIRGDFETAVAVGAEGADALTPKLAGAGVRAIKVKNLVREINLARDIAALIEIRKIIKKEKPDILHTNSAKAGVLGALAATRLGIKVVYTVHGWAFLEPLPAWKRALYFTIEKIACRFRHATILLGKREKDVAQKNKLDCGSMAVIPHGIDAPAFLTRDEARARVASRLQIAPPDGALWLGTIANLYKTKDIPNLMRAVAGMEENIFTVILGKGPEKKNLENIITKLNLSSRFALAGEYNNAAELMSAFDIFVLPSAKEGLPYALLEAMAAGLPIVATSVGAIPEMIENNKSGMLVPPRNAEALRGALKKLILDAPARRALGKSAEDAFGVKYKKDRMVNATRELYLSISGSGPIKATTRDL